MPPSTDAPVQVAEIEFFAETLDIPKAAEAYRRHGCLVVRGLSKPYVEAIRRDIEETAQQSIALLPEARQVPEGWITPNGALFLPAPAHYDRDKQIMLLPVSYRTSGAFFQSAVDPKTVDLVSALLGEDVELFGEGQCLYKEPVGGHPKKLHQDSAYFEHRYEGPVAILNYAVDNQSGERCALCRPRHASARDVDSYRHRLASGAG